MLMHCSVTPAFGGASAAECDAGGELGFLKLAMPGLVGTGDDMSGRGTDRRAIEIEPDARDQFLDVLFRQACIGASGAGFNTVEAGIDAVADGVSLTDMLRMRMEQGADRGHP